jgi:hypothetical protein
MLYDSTTHTDNICISGLMSKQNNDDDLLPKILLSLSFFFVFRIIKWMFNRGWFNRFL